MTHDHVNATHSRMKGAEVFVTGVGVISPAGAGVARTWTAARERRFPHSSLPAPLDSVLPDERCARIAPEMERSLPLGRGARRFLSEAARHFLVCSQEALRESQLTPQQIRRFGIAVGSSNGERSCRAALRPFLGGTPQDTRRFRPPGPVQALQAQPGLIASNLAIACGAGGPVLTFINDGLASGIALGEALRAVANGACPGMLAGGCGEVDDPWLLLARREARPAHGPPLPWASTAACLVVESHRSLHARGAVPLAELLGYWQGEPVSALRAAARACRGLEVATVLGNPSQQLQALGFSAGTGEPPAARLPADCLAASQALYVALAIHALRGQPPCTGETRRRAALSVDCDDRGSCTVLLVADPPFTPAEGS